VNHDNNNEIRRGRKRRRRRRRRRRKTILGTITVMENGWDRGRVGQGGRGGED
jgi:hypothetical protein